VEEGQEAIDENATTEAKDVMLIAAAQRVEHYEIAGYTSAISLAKALGLTSVVKSLSTTLGEEVATDAKLSKANESAIATTKKSEDRSK
jgi:ferritin-like metal-binding protein YciE